jgi:hypothetical protein
MKLLAILLLSLSLPAFAVETTATIDDQAARDLAWIEDADLLAQVVEYAKAGQPNPLNSYVTLPANVKADIVDMTKHRFYVESDYDERITKLYVMDHAGDLATDVGTARQLALMLNVPSSMIGTIYKRTYGSRERQFIRNFEGLYIGGDYVGDTSISRYLRDLLDGHDVVVHTFGPEEISLYPGGGFNTTFYLIITDSHVVYAKKEW